MPALGGSEGCCWVLCRRRAGPVATVGESAAACASLLLSAVSVSCSSVARSTSPRGIDAAGELVASGWVRPVAPWWLSPWVSLLGPLASDLRFRKKALSEGIFSLNVVGSWMVDETNGFECGGGEF